MYVLEYSYVCLCTNMCVVYTQPYTNIYCNLTDCARRELKLVRGNFCWTATMFLKILSRTYKHINVRLECVYVYIAGAVVYSQTYNYYCWVNKRKQSIKASIRILSTEYNERRLFARSSCQTGIQTHTHTQTQLWVHIHMYACVFLHIHALAKREQDFCSIALSPFRSLSCRIS